MSFSLSDINLNRKQIFNTDKRRHILHDASLNPSLPNEQILPVIQEAHRFERDARIAIHHV